VPFATTVSKTLPCPMPWLFLEANALLVKTASAFRSSIILRHGDKEISAKKMIALMSLGLKQGDKLEIRIEGEDEEQAGQAMKKILEEQL
jgi:phosphocarrier protein